MGYKRTVWEERPLNSTDKDIRWRLVRLDGELAASYEGRKQDVLAVIAECRDALRGENGELGKWERAELDYAEQAVGGNLLRLAVFCAMKAIEVHQLPLEEYEHGFNYGRSGRGRDG